MGGDSQWQTEGAPMHTLSPQFLHRKTFLIFSHNAYKGNKQIICSTLMELISWKYSFKNIDLRKKGLHCNWLIKSFSRPPPQKISTCPPGDIQGDKNNFYCFLQATTGLAYAEKAFYRFCCLKGHSALLNLEWKSSQTGHQPSTRWRSRRIFVCSGGSSHLQHNCGSWNDRWSRDSRKEKR